MAIGAALLGGVMQASAANKAAKAQKQAANSQLKLQERMYDESVARVAPWVSGGQTAQEAMLSMLGLGDAPTVGGTTTPLTVETFTRPGEAGYYTEPRGDRGDARWVPATAAGTGYRVGGQEFGTLAEAQEYADANATTTGGSEWSWQQDPGYQFRLGEGVNALEAGAAARGGLNSGSAMKALQKFGQDYGSAEFGNVFNRLAGVSGTGLSAASMGNAAGQNYATGAGNALSAYGNASAAGAIGVGNAINSGIGNALGVWQYQRNLPQPRTDGAGSWGGVNGNGSWANGLFGGSGLGSFW